MSRQRRVFGVLAVGLAGCGLTAVGSLEGSAPNVTMSHPDGAPTVDGEVAVGDDASYEIPIELDGGVPIDAAAEGAACAAVGAQCSGQGDCCAKTFCGRKYLGPYVCTACLEDGKWCGGSDVRCCSGHCNGLGRCEN